MSLIAVAPDDETVIAWVDKTVTPNKVFASTNSGSTMKELTNSGVANIRAIDVAAKAVGEHMVCVGGDDGAGSAEIANFDLGDSVPKWTAMETWAGMDGASSVAAVEFSPIYPSDKVMTAVTETDGADDVFFEICSYSSKKWNNDAGFADYTGSGHKILSGVANCVPLQAADIDLLPSYLGADEVERKGFVALATNAACATEGGIYRMSDERDTVLKSDTNCGSVAYEEGELLVAVISMPTSFTARLIRWPQLTGASIPPAYTRGRMVLIILGLTG
jgi:hypothetical protein